MYTTPGKDDWRRFHGPQAVQSAAGTDIEANRATPVSDITVLRSSQVDAAHLDEELSGMLREQVTKTLSFLDPVLMGRFQPEIAALLDFLIFRFSVWEGRPLPGMYLMNLRYRDESKMHNIAQRENHSGIDGPALSKRQRVLYLLGSIVLPYFWSRAHTYLASRAVYQDSPSTAGAWKALRTVETLYRVSSLLNSLVFLGSGRYRSLLERILRARPVYNRELASRSISYEYLNRQLVWAEVSEVLLFLLPLVNIAAVKRFVRTKLPKLSLLNDNSFVPSYKRHDTAKSSEDVLIQCKICQRQDVIFPYAAQPCGHVFCYYCIHSNTLADSQYECPACFVRVDALKPAYSIV